MAGLHSSPVSEFQRLVQRVSRLTFVEACKEAREVEGEALGEDGAAGVDAQHTMAPHAANPPGLAQRALGEEGGLLPFMKEEICQEVWEQLKGL